MTEKTFNDYASAGADQLDDYDFAPHDYNYGFSLNDGKWETYLIAEWHNLELTESEIEARFREVFPDAEVSVELADDSSKLEYSTKAYLRWVQPEVTWDADVEETFENNDAIMTKLVEVLYGGD